MAEHFLSPQLSAGLRSNLLALYDGNTMKAAGIGHHDQAQVNVAIRSDKIYWLDKNHNDAHENAFFERMDAFVHYLNISCYTGIKEYEFHYAMYEKGSFYKRHIDRFRDDDRRLFSMIMYLNENWQSNDGGQLGIYQDDGQVQYINPTSGKSIFFKSDVLEHEVLETNVPRMSITGWFK